MANNNLTQYKRPKSGAGTLPEKGKEPARRRDKTPLTKKQIGRPKKKPTEKRDYKVVLSLTQEEGRKLKEKAGLTAEATFLYAQLKGQGLFK